MAADLHRIAVDVGAAAISRGPDVPRAAGNGGLRRGLLEHRGVGERHIRRKCGRTLGRKAHGRAEPGHAARLRERIEHQSQERIRRLEACLLSAGVNLARELGQGIHKLRPPLRLQRQGQ